jgi:hypothetical protein
MFNTKQTVLFQPPVKKIVATNQNLQKTKAVPVFVQAAQKKTVETRSGNGAKKLSSTLDAFVDSFGKLGTYKAPRSFAEIEKDCELLWGSDPLTSVKFIHYLRTITRKVNLFDGSITDEPQKGGELKFEPIMRMIWLSQKSPEVFWKNIGLFVSLGSWHDIFTMLQYDLVYNGWDNRKLDWNKFGSLILSALNNEKTNNLVKKYLPQVKARSDCKTVESQANCLIAKWICSLLFGPKDNSYNYKQYRKLKTSGTAHDWQKLISQRKFESIEFDKIHGRALNLLVRSKFLKNQNLSDKYAKWVGDPKTSVKYTGFVHELFSKLPVSLSGLEKHTQDTINKQFATLVEKGKSDKKETSTRFLVARDISTSMKANAVGVTMSSFDVAKAIALYFSEFLTGPFANSYLTFESSVTMHQWVGNSALEKWYNDRTNPFGSTNFQGVIDLFVKLKRDGISEEDFPTGVIAISDGDFNPTHCGKTNVDAAKAKLRGAGFSDSFVNNFEIVLWNIPNGFYSRPEAQFETTANETGAYYFSGLSPSVIQFITGCEVLTPRQVFDKALDQEILNMVTL